MRGNFLKNTAKCRIPYDSSSERKHITFKISSCPDDAGNIYLNNFVYSLCLIVVSIPNGLMLEWDLKYLFSLTN